MAWYELAKEGPRTQVSFHNRKLNPILDFRGGGKEVNLRKRPKLCSSYELKSKCLRVVGMSTTIRAYWIIWIISRIQQLRKMKEIMHVTLRWTDETQRTKKETLTSARKSFSKHELELEWLLAGTQTWTRQEIVEPLCYWNTRNTRQQGSSGQVADRKKNNIACWLPDMRVRGKLANIGVMQKGDRWQCLPADWLTHTQAGASREECKLRNPVNRIAASGDVA